MVSLGKILSLVLIAGTKFLLAPFVAESPPYNLEFWEAFLITTLGGFAGIVLFVFFGDIVASKWSLLVYSIKRLYKSREQLQAEKAKPKKRFSWKTRFIGKVRRRFGLMGIAFVTPCIISIPIGSMVAVGIYRNKYKVLSYISAWLVVWSFALNILAQYFGFSKYFIH
ncbi:MAG: hypothetical protein AB1458_09190 [Bacteroidota bacterium]